MIKALVDLKIHYPEAVEELLYSLSDLLKEHQIKVKGSRSRSVEIITRQMAIACGKLIRHLVSNSDIRSFYAEGWASAAKYRSFGQWIKQVFIKIINRVMDREFYREIIIDD